MSRNFVVKNSSGVAKILFCLNILATLGADSVNFTAGIGNAVSVLSGDSWKGKPSKPIRPSAVFFFWLQYFLSDPNTLDEYSSLSLKNTSAVILYFSSTLV